MMTSIYFHDYAGSTYNRQHFDMFCEEWGYKVTESHSEIDAITGDRVTVFVTDKDTAIHLHCHFPHNAMMGYPIEV